MSTQALPHAHERLRLTARPAAAIHSLWLAGGLLLAFLVPFVLADSLDLPRDLYYALYGAFVIGYFALWATSTAQPIRRLAATRLPLTLALSALASAVLVLVVFRNEDATARPDGLEFVGAVLWRGVFYGAVDGLLLSVFPILAVFAAFRGSRLRRSAGGTVVVGLVALAATLAMTAVYHVGYSDFRSEKLRKPVVGDVMWSSPTLLTLNPVGAPIAHIALHTAAVTHSYDTDTFLPPHEP